MSPAISITRYLLGATGPAGPSPDEASELLLQDASARTASLVFQRTEEASTLWPAPVGGVPELLSVRAGEGSAPAVADLPGAIAMTETYRADDVVDAMVRSRDWSTAPVFRFAMHRFRISTDNAEAFEQGVKQELEIVRNQEPGTVLYTFFRRSAVGSLLPASKPAHSEYVHLMAFESEEAQALHRELESRKDVWSWGSVFPDLLAAPLENEAFFADQVRHGASRDSDFISP